MMQKLSRKLRKFDYKKYLKANRSNVILWCSFAVFVMFIYHFFSDGDFSFLLTLGSIVSCFGFTLVLVKSFYSKSVAGVSLKSLQCFLVVYVLRLIAICFTQAYLPYDKSGDWFYQLVEGFSLLVIMANIYLIMGPFKYTHNMHHDTWGQQYVDKRYTALLLIVPSLILALIVRPQRSGRGFFDFCWAASMYLEGVAILPQLHMFQKNRTGEIESFTSHFVFSLFVSKLLVFFFWMSSWKELNGSYGFISSHFAGLAIILSQISQLALMASYVFYYLRSAIYDAPMVLPTSLDMRSDFFVCWNYDGLAMNGKKALFMATGGLVFAYLGYRYQERYIENARKRHQEYIEAEVQRRLKEESAASDSTEEKGSSN